MSEIEDENEATTENAETTEEDGTPTRMTLAKQAFKERTKKPSKAELTAAQKEVVAVVNERLELNRLRDELAAKLEASIARADAAWFTYIALTGETQEVRIGDHLVRPFQSKSAGGRIASSFKVNERSIKTLG
jgi:hypothetical protein